MKRSMLKFAAPVFLVLCGFALLFTPVRFCGGLLIGLAAVTALWLALKGKKLLRRILSGLLCIGFLIFAAAEARVVAYSLKKDDSDVSAVIVLGAGVYGTNPSLSLLVRLEAALDYVADKPEIPVVVSGGQGSGEDITEARCMAEWLIANGLDASRIIQEDQSTRTEENLRYSLEKLALCGIDPTDKIAVVSADYHVYRASLYYGLSSMVPVPAKMPGRWWPLTVNYYVREAFGVIYYRIFEA